MFNSVFFHIKELANCWLQFFNRIQEPKNCWSWLFQQNLKEATILTKELVFMASHLVFSKTIASCDYMPELGLWFLRTMI
jgi:hypothetical protein